MIRSTVDLTPHARDAYDALIDVRSPGEFAEDHIPGAINLPVLDDAQRTEVGTLYVQRSKFLARRTGAAHVARNIAAHLEDALSDRDGAFRPLVYCWRGGQRSGAMVTVMDQVGWPVTRLEGGYQTWRRLVTARLYADEAPGPRVVLLDGLTGSGKTGVLNRLAARGAQALDLEGLARHRGSVFGATDAAQPSQKRFESLIADALSRLDPARPVVVEAESSKVGRLMLPPVLWRAMKAAPRIELTAPVEARVDRVLADYETLGADVEAIQTALGRLPRHHSKETIAAWREMARAGRLADLARALMTDHYDPAYRRGRAGVTAPLVKMELPGLSDADLDTAADRVTEAL